MLRSSIDLDHLHLAMAGSQHHSSLPGIVSGALRQLGRLGEPKRDQRRIPDRPRLVSNEY